MGSILFKIFIEVLDSGESTAPGGSQIIQNRAVAKTSQGCDAIQRDLERLKNLNERNLMKLNKGKHPVKQTLPLLDHLPSWLGGVSHPCDVTVEGL